MNLWDSFMFSFCKVEFLCWNGEPNWLGWIVLVFFGFIVLGVISLFSSPSTQQQPVTVANCPIGTKLEWLVKENPHRPQTESWDRAALYWNAPTVAEFLARGGRHMDLSWEAKCGRVKIKERKARVQVSPNK